MIEVTNLCKDYGSQRAITPGASKAIDQVSFRVDQGEVMGLLGVNGAGKTTIMRILAGALGATKGTALIAGYDINRQPLRARQQLGYLPEVIPLYPDMTVSHFLSFAAEIKQVPSNQTKQQVQRSIELCGLTAYQNSLIRKLSQGYRQRLGIAQAIVHQPAVIILDEPTRGLDPNQIIKIRSLIQQLAQEHTILLSSHLLAEVEMTCQRLTVIDRGRVIATDTPANLGKTVGAAQHYELAFSGDPEVVAAVLQRIPQIQSVELIPADAPEPLLARRLMNVRSIAGQDIGSAMITVLVQEGIEVHEVRRSRANLEEVFLALTKSPVT
jgi:ABC-2 type transport system ATP-binding protein